MNTISIDEINSSILSNQKDIYSEINIEDIPDINNIYLSKKETFYYKIIDKYYKTLNEKKINMMIDIINGKSHISLRLLDWFITKYSYKYKTRFGNNGKVDINFDEKIDKVFNVHISYKAQLKSYKKRYFDPFRRREKFKYYFDKEKKKLLITTLGQLNFFKWAFCNDIIEYVNQYHNIIAKSMINTNKLDKTKKNLNHYGVNVSLSTCSIQETESNNKIENSIKIILSFD